MIDAHCHLQDERLARDLEHVIARAKAVGVEEVVCCGSSEEDWSDVLRLAERYPGFVVPALGLHPWYLRQRSSDWFQRLENELQQNPRIGIGECGLDGAIEPRDDAEQMAVLRAHFELARAYRRPVWLHVRKAWDRLPNFLRELGPHEPGIVIHSYSGGASLVKPLLEWNVYFSFSGTITRTNNRRGREALLLVPDDRLLVETDAPDLSPVIRNRATGEVCVPEVNEPQNLLHVVEAIAEIRGGSPEQIGALTAGNARRLFQFLGRTYAGA